MAGGTDVGTGSTVTFGTSNFSAELLSLSWSGISREAIDISHMGTTTGRTFMPTDLFDPGELSMDVHFNPSWGTNVPWSAAAETITITFPKYVATNTAADWEASGFVTDFEFTDPLEDKMTASLTVKFTGDITQTDEA